MPGGIQIASAADTDTGVFGPNPITETRELPAQLARALFEGPTIWVSAIPSVNGEATFAVPLPATPGFYRLQAAAWSPEGNFVTESLDLDTRRDIELSVDVPEQMLPGDRGYASLILTNKGTATARVRVTFDGGPGLQVEDLRMRTSTAATVSTEGEGALAIALEPHSTVTVQAGLEAAVPGPGTATLAAETEHGRQIARASYTIVGASAPGGPGAPEQPATADIEVNRTLYLLKERPETRSRTVDEDSERQFEQSRWQRIELEPEQRVSPGQLILVEERIVADRTHERIDWRQDIPGNCHTHVGERNELAEIGIPRGLRRTGVTYRIERLEAGQHTREYVIVAVRPGVCRYPAPEMCADGQPLRVPAAPPSQFVFVADLN
jgi:hypothetical protein